jgi:autotransporter-associated beta strand protein/T5SS/PEP-CTERM-associated repeat protein
MLEGPLMRLASLVSLFTCKGSTPKSPWALGLVLAALLVVGLPTRAVRADTTLNSGTTTVSTGTNFGGELYVATTGTATLNVIAGGSATNTNGYLGQNAGGVGTANVSSGTWANSGNLYVGNFGTGTLNVNGGNVTSAIGYISYNNGNVGTATVSSGTWANSGGLVVGDSGLGTLNVTGGYVSNRDGTVGNSSDGVGIANVSSGTWANSRNLTVGNLGTGTLNVNGGYVSNTNGILGNNAGRVGTATVSGGTWANSGNLTVGVSGTGLLTMSGGLVSVAGTLSQGTYGTINLNAGGTLQIGVGGAGGVLGVSTLVNNGMLIFNRSDASTYSGVINGTGAVAKQGGGTLTLEAANTYTGLTTISAGTLQIGSGGTTGSIAGNVVNNSSLIFNRSNAKTYSGVISGTGAVAKQGGGTLTLEAANTYTGLTTISAGTLQIGSGGTTGSIAGNVVNNSSLIFNRSDASTFAGSISGTGAVTKQGEGTLTLSGNNSYTGGTTIIAGTVTISAGSSISHDSAGLVIGQASGETGTLNVAGGIVTNGASIIGNNLFSIGTVTVSSGTWATHYDLTVGYGVSSTGTLNVSGGSVTNGGQGIIGDDGSNGTVTVSSGTWGNSGDLKVGVDGGTGTLTMNGGLVSVAGTLSKGTYGTINLNSGGTLQIGIGSTDGVLLGGTGSLVNNGTLVFNRSDASTYSGVISGAGALRKQGAGTLTLDGDNSYTGGTTISDGVLQVGAGRTTGSIAGNVVNNSSLIFNRSDDSNYSGIISGTGTIQNDGTGTTTLTGQTSFTNGLGATAGRLIVGSGSSVNGFSTTGNLTAASGATLELKSRGLAYVNGLSTLTSGTILAANGISLGGGANVVGTGVVSGRVAAGVGSRVEASGGRLTLGDAASYSGIYSSGELYTNANEVELLDRNLAVLGSLTQLGDGSAGGTLRAANGMLLEQGKNLVGRGTVYGDFVNQGDVYGDGSAAGQVIVFAAGSTVSGIGSFENVVFDGTYSPGNSPAITNLTNGQFSSASSLLIELGGTQPGTQYDRVVDSGVLTLLGGTLNVALYNGFVPSLGDSFEILQYGQLSGDFGTVIYPTLSGGFSWARTTSATAMTITVVPEPSTYAMAIAGLACGGWQMWRRRRLRQAPTLVA